MFHIESSLNDIDFAKMTFSEKMSMAKDLAVNYGLTIFLVLLLGTIFIGALSIIIVLFADLSLLPTPGLSASAVLRLGLGTVVIAFIALLFIVGVNTLVLYYIDGNEPYSIFAIIIEPWANLGSVIWSAFLWLGVGLVFSLIFGLVFLIPTLGFVIGSIGCLFFLMIICCAGFYLADQVIYRSEELSARRAVLDPIVMVKRNIVSWLLLVFVVIVVLSMPASLIMGLGVFMALDSKCGIFVLCTFLSTIYFITISIFILFLVALTYIQTSAHRRQLEP